VLRTDFAVSPAHFINEDFDWIDPSCRLQFPMIWLIGGYERILQMALACILHHKNEWMSFFLPNNHIFLVASYVHRSEDVLSPADFVRLTYPWSDPNVHFTGIPPHVSVLQELAVIKERQQQLVGSFVSQMREVLEEMGINGGRMSEENLRRILQEFQERFAEQLRVNNIQPPVVGDDVQVVVADREEAGEVYPIRFYAGAFKRVPLNWRFPRCGIFDLWRQWWIGDTVQGIPPLRKLEVTDVNHLDDIPLAEDEMHGRTGAYKDRRRSSTKVLSDMFILMEYIMGKVTERGVQVAVITAESVDRMFLAIADVFTEAERDAQKRWLSVLLNVRARERAARPEGAPPPPRRAPRRRRNCRGGR
jgi:hypothetical protein